MATVINTAQTKASGSWKLTGAVVQKFRVWANSKTLTAVQVIYTDNTSSPIYGAKDGNYAEYVFAPGEAVNSLVLWGNGVGTRTGHIKFTTNRGGQFEHGKDVSGQTAYAASDIGSGILMGIVGRSGAEIDCLGLVFLTKVNSVTIKVCFRS